MTAVVARLAGGQKVMAAITREASQDLGLEAGMPVAVLIKSTEIGVAVGDVGRVSIRNLLPGRVLSVDHGEVMTSVKIQAEGAHVLTAVITRESAEELGLRADLGVTAMVKSTDVAVAVE
jgi:molybdate transport system regulatory protein